MPAVASPHAIGLSPAPATAAVALPRLGLLEIVAVGHLDLRGARGAEAAEEAGEEILRLRRRGERRASQQSRRTRHPMPDLTHCHYAHPQFTRVASAAVVAGRAGWRASSGA